MYEPLQGVSSWPYAGEASSSLLGYEYRTIIMARLFTMGKFKRLGSSDWKSYIANANKPGSSRVMSKGQASIRHGARSEARFLDNYLLGRFGRVSTLVLSRHWHALL